MSRNKEHNGPNISLFGEELGVRDKIDDAMERDLKEEQPGFKGNACEGQYCRDSGGAVFGLLVFFTGVVLLLNYSGWVPWEFWRSILFMWPVLLILIGVQIILGSNLVARLFIFLLALAAIIFIVGYGIVQSGSPLANYFPEGVTSMFTNINHYKN